MIKVLEHIVKMNTIYDILALCCSYVFNKYAENPIEFAVLDTDKYNCVYDAVQLYCEQCEEVGHTVALNEFKNYIIKFLNAGITVEKCYAIIVSIDELVEGKISNKLLGKESYVKYDSLNTQFKDKVKILPKFENTFINRNNKKLGSNNYGFLRKCRQNDCSPIDSEISNYTIWNEEYIKKYPLWIYHFDETSIIAKHFYQRNQVVLGIVPFTDIEQEKLLDVRYKNRAFYIENVYPDVEKKLKKKYDDICNKAQKEKVDFLIFPEMLMTENILNNIDKERDKKSFRIIVNGSIWKDKTNRSIVANANGDEIFSYFKKNPYKFKKNGIEYTELLDKSKNTEYPILEFEGFGRVGIGICKDLISEEVKLFHKIVGTNLLIVPAYTGSMDLESSAENLSREYNCIVVVVNACSALEKRKENARVGFITLPAKIESDRTGVTIQYYRNECASECEKACRAKKIIIDFEKKNTYEKKESFFVSETIF